METKHVPYFLEYFPQVPLISDCAYPWVQFEDGNNSGAGSISLTEACVHSITRILHVTKLKVGRYVAT